MSAEPSCLTVEQAVAGVANGEFSVTELLTSQTNALEKLNPQLNALARLETEHAQAAATIADALPANARGPLHGAVLAHKDLYMREGWAIEAGSRIMNGHVADRTSFAISALDRAGAIDFGRLNTVEFALGISGHNEITGHVRNPWNPDHIAGGSSSGSAAAVASGCVPAALGSDTGGSIRLPAAACGLVGLKPTFGLVSRSGVFPLSESLDTVGPLTRTVCDAALILQAISGHDLTDPHSVNRPPVNYLADIEQGAVGVRLGIPETYFSDDTDDEVLGLTDTARGILEAEGATIKSTPIDERMRDANGLTTLIITAEGAAIHRRWLETRAADYGSQTLARLMPGLFIDAASYLTALDFRKRFATHILRTTFRDVDLLLTPLWPTPIPRIDETDVGADEGFSELIMQSARNTRPFNFLGFPAMVIPCGFTRNGLPCAIQLVARPFEEAMLLRIARAFEREVEFPGGRKPAVSV